MDYRNLNTKPSGLYRNNQEIIDLFSLTYAGGPCTKTVVYVSKEYVARPDLISLAVYGSDTYTDVICRFNGISNPFDLNEGMQLFIPFLSDVPNLYNQQPTTSVEVTSSAVTSLDLESSLNTSLKKLRSEKHKPNELLEDEQNFVKSEELGLIFY